MLNKQKKAKSPPQFLKESLALDAPGGDKFHVLSGAHKTVMHLLSGTPLEEEEGDIPEWYGRGRACNILG